ncbi:Pilin [Legionella massiliensis]|uniref:Pilin n=1 Tax=Legionella massiliensis TaxID=1034943 RepID=A0A078KRJ5_9GAMM|nr:pilin [Legionella massiliensis]CDZ77040.1 Pilin [Legionella massiliensis]CEE12778.1 Fimbrial protein precursor [Legionella massiliensis]
MKQKGLTLIELMIVIAILGILISIAVPAYRDHAVRARVTEGLHLAQAAKLSVSERVMATNSLPASQVDTGYTSPNSTANVQSIVIGAEGVITITYTKLAGNGTITLVPTVESNGDLSWSCTGGTLLRQYRPSTCR